MTDYTQLLAQRAEIRPAGGWLQVESLLRHFALISYAIPAERMKKLLPPGLELLRLPIDGQPCGLISVAVFFNQGFHYTRLVPSLRLNFGQTNYRIYVQNADGDPGIWFLGTSLGSVLYRLPRLLWDMPWHGAKYSFDCPYHGGYRRFAVDIRSAWGKARIEAHDTGEPMPLLPGFDSRAQQALLLTHPISGYFTRRDGRIGKYSIWHPPAQLTRAEPGELYFKVLETSGLLTRAQMQRPHWLLLQHEIAYDIHLPPQIWQGRIIPPQR